MQTFGPIQTVPRGLLGLLQLKSRGQNPIDISDLVSPIISLFDFWMNGEAQNITNTGAGEGIPTRVMPAATTAFQGFVDGAPVVDLIVPQDEVWFVTDYTIFTGVLAATDIVNFACGFRTPQVGNTWQIVKGAFSGEITGSATGKRAYASSSNFFLPPGSQAGIQVSRNDSAGTITYSGCMRAVRMPV